MHPSGPAASDVQGTRIQWSMEPSLAGVHASRDVSIGAITAQTNYLRLPVIHVACNLRTCAVCRLHGTQSADCMVTVQTKDPSKTCDSFSKFQRNLRFSARINFLTKLPNLKENNLCLFDNGYYSFSCLYLGETMTSLFARNERLL